MSGLNCVSPLYETIISKEEIALWLYLQPIKTYSMCCSYKEYFSFVI